MPQCPNCQNSIPDQDFETGLCSACGAMLREDDRTLRVTGDGGGSMEGSSADPSVGDETIPVTIALTSKDKPPEDPKIRESIDFSQPLGDDDDSAGSDWSPSSTSTGNDSLDLSASVDLESDSGPSGSAGSASRSTRSRTRVRPETHLVIQTREVRKLSDEGPGQSRERSVEKPAEEPPARYDYEFLGKIGEGGMGVVYKARQGSVGREVAVKMLHPKSANEPTLRDSFLSEAVVNGDLDHPNIVPVYDLGKDKNEGLFYAMKQVKGRNWDKVIASKKLSENLEILMKVADAIAFAHSHGVVHRDLKPENVVIGDFGEVFVVDWGVARVMPGFEKANGIIGSDGLWGTPAYAAPEILTGPLEAIGPHSDVYLLGALLYEIVAGFPPHYGRTVSQCKAAAKLNEIRPTERTGELVDIALKAMETEPADRYASVQAFQQAIRDYQSHSESIVLATSAKADLEQAKNSNDYKDYNRAIAVYEKSLELWKDNHAAQAELPEAKLAYALCALKKGDFELGLSLADQSNPSHRDVIAKLTAAQAERASRQRRLTFFRRAALAASLVAIGFAGWAEVQRQEAVKQTGIAETNATEAKRQEGIAKANEKTANDNAVEAVKQQKLAEANEAEAKRQQMLAEASEKEAKRQEAIAKKNEDEAKKQQMLAEASEKEAKRQEAIAKMNADEAKKQQMLAEASAAEAKRQEAEARRQAEIARYEAYVAQIGFASAKVDDNVFDVVRDVLDKIKTSPYRGWEWSRLSYLSQLGENIRLDAPAEAVAVDSRQEKFVVGGQDGKAVLRRFGELKNVPAITLAHGSPILAAEFTTNDEYVATAGADGTVQFWDSANGNRVKKLTVHSGPVNSIQFLLLDGRQQMLTSSDDRTARLWDVSGAPDLWHALDTLLHHKPVLSAVISPDGRQIVTAGADGAGVWKRDGAKASQRIDFLDHQGSEVLAAAFSPNGKVVATADADGRVIVWEPASISAPNLQRRADGTEQPKPSGLFAMQLHNAPVKTIRFSPDGRQLLTGSNDNTVKVWNWDEASRQATLYKTLQGHSGWVRACAFLPKRSDKGQWLVLSAGHDRSAKIWDVAGYEPTRTIRSSVMGHEDGAILGAAFDLTGNRVITASRDHTARVWNVKDGSQSAVLSDSGELKEGHDYLVSSAVYFPDGKTVLTAGIDSRVLAWDVATGAQLWRLDDTGLNAAVAVALNGKWIATGSKDSNVKLWKVADVMSEPELVPLGTHAADAQVTALAFSPDGNWLFSGDNKGAGILWDLTKRSKAELPKAHSRHINTALFLADGSRLLTASDDGTVAQWKVDSREQLKPLTLDHFGERVVGIAAAADGTTAVTVSLDRGEGRKLDARTRRHLLRQWRLADAVKLAEIPLDSEFVVTSVALSRDGKTALTASGDKSGRDTRLRLWNLAERKEKSSGLGSDGVPLPFLKSSSGTLVGATYSPDDSNILTFGSNAAHVRVAKDGAIQMSLSPHGSVASASFSSDGNYAVTGSWDQSLKIWDIKQQKAVQKVPQAHTGRINAALFSPANGSFRMLTVSRDGTAKIWDWRDKVQAPRVLYTLSHDKKDVLGGAFSPKDGNRVVTASADGKARIWDVEQGKLLHELVGHKDRVSCAAFSADGNWVATAGEDKTVIVWNAMTGKQAVEALQGHTAGITSVAFYGNGDRIITGSRDGTAKLWDPEIAKLKNQPVDPMSKMPVGREVLTLRGHTSELTSVSFSPNGQYALTASQDGTAILWLTQEPQREDPKAAMLNR